jgi:hypothetical protein
MIGLPSPLAAEAFRLRGALKEARSPLLLEGQIDGSTPGARPVDCAGRHHDTLPGIQAQRRPSREIDLETAFHDQEQLVRIRMVVPRVFAGHDGQSEAAGIDASEDLVPVVGCDRRRLRRHIHDSERGKAGRLGGRSLGRRAGWTWSFYLSSPDGRSSTFGLEVCICGFIDRFQIPKERETAAAGAGYMQWLRGSASQSGVSDPS